GFTHITRIPKFQHTNGEAGHAVATLKGLWKKASDKSKALMAYYATPLEEGFPPAQLLLGRKLCTPLPQFPASLTPKWPNLKEFRRKEAESQNRCYSTSSLPSLALGQKDWITTEFSSPSCRNSYLVWTTRGLLQWNHIHLCSTNQSDTENVPEAQLLTSGASPEGPEQWYRTRSGRCSKSPQKLDL
uniref:Integrase catalytic domain-containing protein n=1 Tax=Latimeria chalumnae TaxID=7897 RepID=H3A1R1_LATCH